MIGRIEERVGLVMERSGLRLRRFLTSRKRSAVRARLITALTGAGCAGAALALWPQAELHGPVAAMVAEEAPPLRTSNVEALLMAELDFEPVDPALAGLDPRRLSEMEAALRAEVRRGAFPGAALVVGRGSDVVQEVGIGRLARGTAAVDPRETLYDIASLTKVVATTTAVMLLVEDGLMELDAPVGRYLPQFSGGAKGRVTVRHLLAHNSGLPAGAGLSSASPEAALRGAIATPLRWVPGARVEYSDLGPVILWAAAERAAGEPLEELLRRRVFDPLGMRSIGFHPEQPCHACAPTAPNIRGRVHDPMSRRLGGLAGNAGLFSTAHDLGRFAAMLAGGGALKGVRVLREETIREFTARQPAAGTRALGWDTPSPRGRGAAGGRISPTAFGHTGFTGTSLWIDPQRGTWTVLLTNRTYTPRAPNRIQALRRTIHDRVADAADYAAAD